MTKKKLLIENDLLEQVALIKSIGGKELEILEVVLTLLLEENHRETGAEYKRYWLIDNRAFAIAYGKK